MNPENDAADPDEKRRAERDTEEGDRHRTQRAGSVAAAGSDRSADAAATPRTTGEPAEDPTGASADRTSDATDGGSLSIPLETLAVLNWLGDEGVSGVEDRINDVLDDDLSVTTEQVKIGYAEQSTVAEQFRGNERGGARVLLRKPLVGNVLVVFPMESANKAAALMLQRAVEDLSSVSTEMGRDALTELCNMMANGFVDEWADVFDASIDTGAPVAVQDPERTLVARILKQYDVGLFIRSRLRIPRYDVNAAIYVFPGREEFVTKLSGVGLEVIE